MNNKQRRKIMQLQEAALIEMVNEGEMFPKFIPWIKRTVYKAKVNDPWTKTNLQQTELPKNTYPQGID